MSMNCKTKLVTVFLGLSSLLIASNSDAQPAWYYGHIDRIFMYTGGFVVKMDSSALSDCKHNYIYFKDAVLGETIVNRAYSMVLSGQSTGRLIGVVIDKAINGPGGYCDSSGSVDIKD